MVVELSPTIRAAYEAQLQHVLNSNTFRNTEVLKRLLEYLGQQELNGEGRELKEYTVGVEAFRKPSDYDPKIDSSVRVQVGKLRQKLDEYYRTQGLNDPVLIQVPKGHFKLEFQERAPRSPSALITARKRSPMLAWTVTAMALFWAVFATVSAIRSARDAAIGERYSSSDIATLWSPFFASKRPVIVSLGTPLFAKISGDFFRNPSLNNWESFTSSEQLAALEKELGGRALPAYPYTGIGEASAAFELSRLFISRHKDLSLVLSSVLSWDDVARNDVIFVGPPKYNLYESDLPVQQDFVIQHGRLENMHPRPGEPTSYGERWAPNQATPLEGYALIARLPGLHGTGCMMMLASTSTEGTRAAVEYVTRPEYASRLVRALRQSGALNPQYFQAVVRARFRSQTPIQIEQVAVHVLH